MTEKRFIHKINRLGMQFICYDEKSELLGTFADAKGVSNIVKLLNELHEENMMLKGEVAHYKLVLMGLEEEAKRITENWKVRK